MDVFEKISRHTKELNSNELELLNYCMHNVNKVKNMKCGELAKEAFMSPASVVRFAKKLGYQGYSDFRYSLSIQEETETQETTVSLPQDIHKTLEMLNEKMVDDVVDMIYKARRVEFFGGGSTTYVCSETAKKFRTIGKSAYNYDDNTMMLISAKTLSEEDVVLAFSVTGETSQVLNSVNAAKFNGTKIISITGISSNTLSKISDINLYADVTVYQMDNISIHSRVELMIIAELIFQKYLNKYGCRK